MHQNKNPRCACSFRGCVLNLSNLKTPRQCHQQGQGRTNNIFLGGNKNPCLSFCAGAVLTKDRCARNPPRAKRSAKSAAKFWRNFSQIFVLQFPGKMAAKGFTKNRRHFPRCTKLSFFTAATLVASGAQKIEAGTCWKKGKDPRPQDEIQHLDFTKDPPAALLQRPLPVYFTHKNVCSKSRFRSLVRTKLAPY